MWVGRLGARCRAGGWQRREAESLQLRARPGSSCLGGRRWHRAKSPWPLHRGAVVIMIPHVPSGEGLSSWNMWHFADIISGPPPPPRARAQRPCVLAAACGTGRSGLTPRRMRRLEEACLCHRWEPSPERLPWPTHCPWGPGSRFRLSFRSGLLWGVPLAWAGLRGSRPGPCGHLSSPGPGFLHGTSVNGEMPT